MLVMLLATRRGEFNPAGLTNPSSSTKPSNLWTSAQPVRFALVAKSEVRVHSPTMAWAVTVQNSWISRSIFCQVRDELLIIGI